MSLPSSGETKYQNLTPVPPIPPPPSLSYNHHHHPPPGHHPQPVPPPHHAVPPPQSAQHTTGHPHGAPHGIYHPGHPPWSHNMAYPSGHIPPHSTGPPSSHSPFMSQQAQPPSQQLQQAPHQQIQPPQSPLSTSAQSPHGMSIQPIQQGQPSGQPNAPPSSHPLGFIPNSGNSGPVPPSPHQQMHGASVALSSQQPQPGVPQQSQGQPIGHQVVSGSASMTNSENTPSNGEKVTKKKRKRCGDCPGCLKKDNCGECGPCKSVRSHQICKMRKCDQLKTKKEKSRESNAAANNGGIREGKPLSVQDGGSASSGSIDGGGPGSRPNSVPGPGSVSGSGSRPGSSSINGTSASSPFLVNQNDGSQHYPPAPLQPGSGANGVTPGQAATAPRSFPEFGPKHWPPVNPMFSENNPVEGASPYNNFTGHPITSTGPFNGETIGGMVVDVKPNFEEGLNSGSVGVVPHSAPPGSGVSDNNNRHQLTNNRLKSLIQNRQSSKGSSGNNGSNNRSTANVVGGQPPNQQTYSPQQQQQPQSQSSNDSTSISFVSTNYVNQMNHQGQGNNSYMSQVNSAGTGLPGRVQATPPTTNSDNTPPYVQMTWTTTDAQQRNGDASNTGHPPTPTTPSAGSVDVKPGRRTPFAPLETSNGFSFGANSYSQYDRNTPSESTYSTDNSRGQQQQQQQQQQQTLPPPSTPTTQQQQQQQSRPASNGNGHQFLSQYGNQQYSPLPMLQQHSDGSTEIQSAPFTNQSHPSATLPSPARSKTPSSGGVGLEMASSTNGSSRDPLTINNNATNSNNNINNNNINSNNNNIISNNSNNINNNNGSGAPPGSNNGTSPNSRDSSGNNRGIENDENAASADQSTQPFLSNTTTSMNTYTNIISTYNTGSSVTGSTVFYTNTNNTSNNNNNNNNNTVSSNNNSSSTPMPCSPIEGNHTSYLIIPSSQQPVSSSNQQFGYFTGAGGHQSVIMTNPSEVSGNLGQQTVTSSGTLGKSSLTLTSSGVGHDMGIECGRLNDDISSTGFGGLLMDLNPYIVNKSDPPFFSSSSSFISSTNESQHVQHHLSYTNSSPTNHTVLPPVSTFLIPSLRDHSWWGSDRSMMIKQTNPYATDLLPVNNLMETDHRHQDLNCESLDCGDEEKGEREYSRSPSTLTSLTTASLTH
ncbi:uncharacterized protein DDB_G0283357 [Tetranychus urticae]|uniref:CXXC-type domain-containing protein n=1 Tax=Tetranychus urticae TaxID=32264 RepID=T1KWD3_TETUR|nr:uncharacterized protein DDB_G0283357 [Tetranychus urticae]